MQSLLQIENLTKSYADRVLFENISFSIADNQRVALIAPNGAGKSTLLKIIMQQEPYDAGLITMRNDLRIGYLSQKPSFPPELSVIDACLNCDNTAIETIRHYEHVLLSGNEHELALATAQMDAEQAWQYESRIKQILGKLQIRKLDQQIGQLSGGQLKRVALANIIISEPDLLILDEPTNHLDLEMIEWLEDYLQKNIKALLLVTHDRYFLDRVCNKIVELDNGQLVAYQGNYEYYLEKKQERIEVHNAETQKYQNLYRTELEWMRRMPQARGHKAQYRIDAFYDLEKKAHQQLEQKQMRLEVKSAYIGSKIFEMKYVTKSYGDLHILKDFYYNFARYEKMGIVGANGTGKTTFLRILLGQEKLDSGSIEIGQTVRFGYYRQDGIQFNQNDKVIDAVRKYAEKIDLGGGKRLSASQFLQHFLFSPAQQNNYIYKLSGGEKQRLHLCTVLIQNPNFLVLDEPTNDLDIPTLNILEQYLQDFKGCVIVVSHDRYFMDKIVDHLLVFKGNAVIKDFPGNYTQYREFADKEERQTIKTTEQPKQQKQKTSERKLSYKEQQELKSIEQQLTTLTDEKQQLEQQLSGGVLAPEEIMSASQRYEQVKQQLDQIEMRWLELND